MQALCRRTNRPVFGHGDERAQRCKGFDRGGREGFYEKGLHGELRLEGGRVDDDGGKKDDEWFQSMCERARIILNDTTRPRRILVHCHMGVNRGPSALFAIMLATGWGSLDALRAIRDARPIAGIIYAPDAISWWAREQSHDSGVVAEMVNEVKAWLDRNPLDLYYVIRSIGNRRAI